MATLLTPTPDAYTLLVSPTFQLQGRPIVWYRDPSLRDTRLIRQISHQWLASHHRVGIQHPFLHRLPKGIPPDGAKFWISNSLRYPSLLPQVKTTGAKREFRSATGAVHLYNPPYSPCLYVPIILSQASIVLLGYENIDA